MLTHLILVFSIVVLSSYGNVEALAQVLEINEELPGIIKVSQAHKEWTISQNISRRGGFRGLLSIQSMIFSGSVEKNQHTFPLKVVIQRPDIYRRTLSLANGSSTTFVRTDHNIEYSPNTVEADPLWWNELLHAFEFDGWLLDWRNKGHKVLRLAMIKLKNQLPWILQVEVEQGQTWRLYIDSHSYDTFRKALIDVNGKESFAMEFEDYREVEGFRLPHVVKYFAGKKLLAVDQYETIQLTFKEEDQALPEAH